MFVIDFRQNIFYQVILLMLWKSVQSSINVAIQSAGMYLKMLVCYILKSIVIFVFGHLVCRRKKIMVLFYTDTIQVRLFKIH